MFSLAYQHLLLYSKTASFYLGQSKWVSTLQEWSCKTVCFSILGSPSGVLPFQGRSGVAKRV